MHDGEGETRVELMAGVALYRYRIDVIMWHI